MLFITLEATNASLNIARSYQLAIEKNLFDQWVLTIGFGRRGRRLVYKYFILATEHDCLSKAKHYLRKRATAEQRIGCAYRLIRLDNNSPVEDRVIESWLIRPTHNVRNS